MATFDRATRCPQRYRRLALHVFTAEEARTLECRDYHDHVSMPLACVLTDPAKSLAADAEWIGELRRIAALPVAERDREITEQRLHDVDIRVIGRFVEEHQRAERRTRAIVTEAVELEQHAESLEQTLARAGSDRSADYAEYMADPAADPERFEDEYDAYLAEMERNLGRVRQRLADLERKHHSVLSAAGWFTRAAQAS